MPGRISLEVVTPQKKVYQSDVDTFVAPGVLGYLGILPSHAPIISALDIGVIKIKSGNAEERLAVGGGFLEVVNNKAVVLAETAEAAEEIDVQRAEAAKQRAEARLAKRSEEVDILRAEMALKRAIARLRAYQGL